MPVDPVVGQLLAMMEAADLPPLSAGTPEVARQGLENFRLAMEANSTGPRVPVRAVEDSTLRGPAGDLPVRVYRPAADGPLPTVVLFHGGGFVIGSLDTHDDMARMICVGVPAVVVSVAYRLAPEHPFPAAVDDCLAATTQVADRIADYGGDAARLAVAGDSAGGNLAAVVSLLARDAVGGPAIAAQALWYPATDGGTAYPSRAANAVGYFLTADDIAWFQQNYTPTDGSSDPEDWRASPLRAPDHAGLPPAVIATAEYDPLHDDGEAYADVLARSGVPVVYRSFDGLVHGFAGMAPVAPACEAASQRVIADLATLLA